MSSLQLLSIVFAHLKENRNSRIFASQWFYWFLSDISEDPSTHNLLRETIDYVEKSTNILCVLELITLKHKLEGF